MNVLDYLKALADPTRLRLINILLKHELSVNELVEALDLGQSRVSHHLKLLAGGGLLIPRRDGRLVFYVVPEEGPAKAFLLGLKELLEADEELRIDLQQAEEVKKRRIGETKRFFNAVADDWDALHSEVLGVYDVHGQVLKHMPHVASAADLGCGTGRLVQRMLMHAETVVGVDNAPAMLDKARALFSGNGNRASFRIGDLEHLPLRDGEAEFAAMCLALHHVAEPAEALAEARRILKAEGRFVLADFDKHENESFREKYGDRRLGFSEDELKRLMSDAGFRLYSHEKTTVKNGLAVHIITAE
jgi:ArsR family transcriptional regulator